MITLFDGILGSFYFLILMLIGWWYSRQKIGEGKLNYRYYLPSLFIHLFGVVFFCLVYGLYYGGGDSYYYFRGGSILGKYIFSSPIEGVSILFNDLPGINVNSLQVLDQMNFQNDSDSFLMMRVTSLISILGIHSFLASSVLVSYISFYFNWKLFKSVNKAFYLDKVKSPKLYYILFIPSLFFWGTAILKDTYVFIFCSSLVISFIQVFDLKNYKFIFFRILLFMICSYFIVNLKPYVFFPLIGSLLVAYYGLIVSNSSLLKTNKVFRYIFNFIFSSVLMGILFFGFQSFQSEILSIQYDAIKTLKGFHDWHTKLGGSSYSLGITDYSIVGILQQSPLAFLVTYFGPFPWQINSPLMLLTALESYFYLYLFIVALSKQRFQLFSFFKKHNIIVFSMIFSIIFGVLVGITSYNYGALARFKIQALPFFLLWLTATNELKEKV